MEININREVEDSFYRYKMPKLSAKVEGKGNGIKTVIVNVTDIAKSLCRKPTYVTKYFGCELGAQVYVDEKNDRYIVNGSHDAMKLQELLDGFIKKFVLCQSCNNPETTLHVRRKAATVLTSCQACGSQGQLDPRHRLTQYIIKNPPSNEIKSEEEKAGKGKKGRRPKATGQNADDEDDDSDKDDHHISARFDRGSTDDDDWCDDTTEEAQQKRLNELSEMAKSLALSADVEKTDTERADIMFKRVKELKKSGEILSHARELKSEAERLQLGPRVVLIIAEVLLSNPETIIADIKYYRSIFVQFTRVGDQHEKAQHYIIGAMCILMEKFESTGLLNKVCHILKQFYDCDILEEEAIIAWHEKGKSKRFVKRELCGQILELCLPMIKWLKEAEEEESSSGESDDECAHEDHATSKTVTEPAADTPDDSPNASDAEIDIDAI